ncbi:MAG: radical SAM family heme chaperone HemW [Clostridia bacterium]|nr:radical SAM family heme chaperone HemW [Clostridia bacterium]
MDKKLEKLGIYIHIPFCVKKCAYCDFYSICDLSQIDAYVKALIEQIKSYRSERKHYLVETIYIGGGTPSLLSGAQMCEIIRAVYKTFKVSDDAEITMEANPGTLDTEKLAGYHNAGINRLSIGLQSADNAELAMLSRIHTKEDFESSFYLARLEGFENINIDLMYALPGQTRETLFRTIEYVTSLEPEHISFYGLTVEPETPFGQNPELLQKIPDDETQNALYLDAIEKLEHCGFLQYEVSNFAKPGFECKHNLNFWHGKEYLGFGPAAHSIFKGVHFSYAKEFLNFIAFPTDKDTLYQEFEKLDDDALEKQYVMLGFRLKGGIDVKEYNKRFGKDFDEIYFERIKPFLDRNAPEADEPYIIKTKTGYRFSRKGFLLSNELLRKILDDEEE